MKDLGHIRENYTKNVLSKAELEINPILQFEKWYNEVEKNDIKDPNAMTLSTASTSGQPSARTVLLKGYSDEGFIFYTNYKSKKGTEIFSNPKVALLFWWKELERQVRIEGIAETVENKVSSAYFHSRPRASQVSAWASPQSQIIDENFLLESRKQTEEKYSKIELLPLPEFWGGYVVKPKLIEFWQGRANRFHDRYQYELDSNDNWNITRLAP